MSSPTSCPSCGGALDDSGCCTGCGALSRRYFGNLDLGAPQIAEAVQHGLDFYRLLDLAHDAEQTTIARRYRRLRVHFPDAIAGLAPEPARRVRLLELAGAVLTEPALRAQYDAMRATDAATLDTVVRRCAGCGAPLAAGAMHCRYCAMAAPQLAAAPAVPPGAPAPAELVDYYALLGLNAAHLVPAAASQQNEPPDPDAVDAAAYARQRTTLLLPALTNERREQDLAQFEIARRLLRHPNRRSQYDLLWQRFARGTFSAQHLDALHALQESVADADDAPADAAEGAALVRQGQGFLRAGLAREAVVALREAVVALPESGIAQAAYARALLAADDPIDATAYTLRSAIGAIAAAAKYGSSLPDAAALQHLCEGLLARDEGNASHAAALLARAAQLDPDLAPAWRGLAALASARGATGDAVQHCRRALALDARDARALTLMVGALLRGRRHDEAREAAMRLAELRDDGTTAERILRSFAA